MLRRHRPSEWPRGGRAALKEPAHPAGCVSVLIATSAAVGSGGQPSVLRALCPLSPLRVIPDVCSRRAGGCGRAARPSAARVSRTRPHRRPQTPAPRHGRTEPPGGSAGPSATPSGPDDAPGAPHRHALCSRGRLPGQGLRASHAGAPTFGHWVPAGSEGSRLSGHSRAAACSQAPPTHPPSEPSEVTPPLGGPAPAVWASASLQHTHVRGASPGCLGPVRAGLTRAPRFLPTEVAAGLTRRGHAPRQGQAPQRDVQSQRGWPGPPPQLGLQQGAWKSRGAGKAQRSKRRPPNERAVGTGEPCPAPGPQPSGTCSLERQRGSTGGWPHHPLLPPVSRHPGDGRCRNSIFSRNHWSEPGALGHAGGCLPQGRRVPAPALSSARCGRVPRWSHSASLPPPRPGCPDTGHRARRGPARSGDPGGRRARQQLETGAGCVSPARGAPGGGARVHFLPRGRLPSDPVQRGPRPGRGCGVGPHPAVAPRWSAPPAGRHAVSSCVAERPRHGRAHGGPSLSPLGPL